VREAGRLPCQVPVGAEACSARQGAGEGAQRLARESLKGELSVFGQPSNGVCRDAVSCV